MQGKEESSLIIMSKTESRTATKKGIFLPFA